MKRFRSIDKLYLAIALGMLVMWAILIPLLF